MATGASVPALISRDAAKKKRVTIDSDRTNRSAKLKQCKLDVRREQWLSQVKSKDDCKILSAANSSPVDRSPRPRADENDAKRRIGEEDAATHGSGDSDFSNPHLSRGNRTSISSGCSMESSSRSVSDEEEEAADQARGESGVLDDWEAVADALSEANDCDNHDPDPVVPAVVQPAASAGISNEPPRDGGTTKPEPIRSTSRAWRPDDASRPRSLPSISKQWSFPSNTDRHCWTAQQKGILSFPCPCPCPICYEDLDSTDSSFFPCSCGFRLCLFCHKRILEADGRCPGCRKQYDSTSGGTLAMNTVGTPPIPPWFSRSFSMSSTSWNREQ
ncbi:hypothetical protein GW17_00018305 [Ensete ventricosum]|nr:hypothetical protein GW17_00018305 [Ensete ventricosum]RZS26381.1 hypothetical protein BHM03_00059714 [Ensete ventricosum]